MKKSMSICSTGSAEALVYATKESTIIAINKFKKICETIITYEKKYKNAAGEPHLFVVMLFSFKL